MDRLLTVDDVAEVLKVSRRTAYTYMAGMIHLVRPLRVAETNLKEWISQSTVRPGDKPKRTAVRRQPQDYRIQKRR